MKAQKTVWAIFSALGIDQVVTAFPSTTAGIVTPAAASHRRGGTVSVLVTPPLGANVEATGAKPKVDTNPKKVWHPKRADADHKFKTK